MLAIDPKLQKKFYLFMEGFTFFPSAPTYTFLNQIITGESNAVIRR